MTTEIIVLIAGIILGYLMGSVNFAMIYSWLFSHKDIREMASGNAGMTNVMRSVGVLPGILTFLGDFLKGIGAVLVGRYLIYAFIDPVGVIIPEYTAIFCGMACQLGHIFPVFYGFRGGKSVATSIGILLMMDWRAGLIAIGVFAAMVFATKIVSISSISGALTAPFSIYFFNRAASPATVCLQTVLCGIIVAVLITAHWQNIGRLIRGEEKKLSISKKKTPADK